jgi:nicotinamidase-related amidase
MDNKIALLVIDVQAGMFDQANPVHNGNALLSTIADLIGRARAAEVPVVYIQHCGSAGGINEPGTPGWEIHPRIAPLQADVVVQKHHPDAFQDTSLRHELEVKGVEKLIVVGIQTEYCVDTTCRRAYSLGYEVTLAMDAHTTWDTDLLSASQIIAHHNQVLSGWFVTLEEADNIEF